MITEIAILDNWDHFIQQLFVSHLVDVLLHYVLVQKVLVIHRKKFS